MAIALSDKQRWSIRNATKRLNIWHGSVRAGKTVGTVWRWLDYIGRAPAGDLLMSAKTMDSLKRNILTPMWDLVGDELQYYPGKREAKIWGRTIYTVGASDERSEGKIRGSTIAGALGDELTLWPESFFKMLLSRMSVTGAQFFGTTNPDNPRHWLKTDYLDRRVELNKDFPNHMGSFHFNIDDNPFLDPTYVQQLKAEYTGLWYKRFILGEWCVAEGAIYDFFDVKKHVIDYVPEAKYYHASIDYGTTNPTAFILFGHNPRPAKGHPRVWAEREYYFDPKKEKRQQTDKEFSDDFKRFIAPVKGKVQRVYCDPSAESFQLQLRRDGVSGLRDAENEVLDGIRTVARMHVSGEYKIHRSCTNLIDEKYGYAWDPKAQEKGEDKPLKQKDHGVDAERYELFTTFGTSSYDISKFKD